MTDQFDKNSVGFRFKIEAENIFRVIIVSVVKARDKYKIMSG